MKIPRRNSGNRLVMKNVTNTVTTNKGKITTNGTSALSTTSSVPPPVCPQTSEESASTKTTKQQFNKTTRTILYNSNFLRNINTTIEPLKSSNKGFFVKKPLQNSDFFVKKSLQTQKTHNHTMKLTAKHC